MKQKPIYASLWPYLLAGLPLVFNVGAFLYQRERARQSVDMSLTRSRKARGAALKILKRAEKSGRTEPRRFYDGAAEALSRYLADRYNLPEIAVTGDSLQRTLAEKSVNADRIDDVRSCLEECDYGRFVSASSSPEKLRQISRRIRKIIDMLEQV